MVDLLYQAKCWNRPRRVVAKIEWPRGEPSPRTDFVFINSRLPADKMIKVYKGRAEIENRIKEGKNPLRRDKTSCLRFEANQARLQIGVLAYNLLHMIRQFYVWGEEARRSIDWLIKRLIKVGARVSYHARRGYIQVAIAFPLAHHYHAVLARGSEAANR
ncbi:MAG: transposase [Desulfobaccales bacterium]